MKDKIIALVNNFNGLSVLQKAGLFLLLVISMGGAYWYFVLDSKLIEIHRVQQSLDQLDKDIARFRVQVAKLPELERDLDVRTKELHYAKTLLPEDAKALEVLLASFEQIGRDENVEFILFQPGSEKQEDFYATRNVQLQISGTFHKLMTYFDRLARLDRLVSIQNIVFNPVSDFSPTDKYLNVKLDLQVYRALTEAELKAREEQKKKK